MEKVHRAVGIVEETLKRVNDTRQLTANTRKLIAAAHRVFEKNLAIYKDAQATTRRLQEHLAQGCSAIERHAPRRSARRRHLLISSRIDEGRLPDTVSRTVLVSGFGGECEACDGYMPPTQLVKAIPKDETFVYLHGDCCLIWKAQCHLRVALRRIV